LFFWRYGYPASAGAIRADAAAVQETAEVLELAKQYGRQLLSLESARFLHGYVW
jgi:hypothetical protein